MTPAYYQPPAGPVLESQWQPHAQLSASAPASYTAYTWRSSVGQQPPGLFYPHTDMSLPLPAPVHQQPEFLSCQSQSVGLDSRHGLKACSPLDKPSFAPPPQQTPKAAQEKTSITLEPATEWAQRVAELRKPELRNPFRSSYRGRPMLIPQPGESEPRLYHPLPSRPGVSNSMRGVPAPPVGSEEDLVARLVRILTLDYVFFGLCCSQALERKIEEEASRRALRREKRKTSTRRESDEDNEMPVKKRKIRSQCNPSRKEGGSSRPAVKPKPLARTRSCPSVSNLMKAVLRL
jgi:hypothetical protein